MHVHTHRHTKIYDETIKLDRVLIMTLDSLIFLVFC